MACQSQASGQLVQNTRVASRMPDLRCQHRPNIVRKDFAQQPARWLAPKQGTETVVAVRRLTITILKSSEGALTMFGNTAVVDAIQCSGKKGGPLACPDIDIVE